MKLRKIESQVDPQFESSTTYLSHTARLVRLRSRSGGAVREQRAVEIGVLIKREGKQERAVQSLNSRIVLDESYHDDDRGY